MFAKLLALGSVLPLAALALSSDPPVGTSFVGHQTYYNTYDTYGSCGDIEHDTDKVAAISPDFGHNVECGRMISIQNTATGATVEAKVVDTCPGCSGDKGHIDLSPAAAKAINPDYEINNVNTVWTFIS